MMKNFYFYFSLVPICLVLLFLLESPFFLPSAVAAVSSPSPSGSSSNQEDDRLALLALKKAILHDPRGSIDSWTATTNLSLCNWNGVACNSSSSSSNGGGAGIQVTSLILPSLDLQGTLSPSIANLTSLRKLDLSANRLSGPLPVSLGRLRYLQSLNLSSNLFSGSIPAEIGSLLELSFLNLSTNDLTGEIPSPLGQLSFLNLLDASYNRLSGAIPSSVGNLSSLRYLILAYNVLGGAIPPQLAYLSNLTYLDLSYNQIHGQIPSLFGRKLSALSVLVLGSNNLTGSIPDTLGSFKSLSYLDLSQNNLSGSIPFSITNLSYLKSIDVSYNKLQGSLPEEWGNLTSLQFFQVSENSLSGSIPSSLYNISSLQTLSVMNNYFSGSLPHNIGDTLPNLLVLNMVGNQLIGTIPTSLGNISGLQQIDLSDNNFTGVIPASLGNLQDLFWLSLGGNMLQAREASDWEFISSLANCTGLDTLILVDNDLGGILPPAVANLSTSLTRLSMGQNQFLGTIPPGIDKLVNLRELGFNDNNLFGNIPDFIGNLRNLEALLLFGNKFSGIIPTTIGNLTRLNELYLDSNKLEGSIPISLANCQYLIALDISINHLNGSIPKQLFSLTALSNFLDLSANELSGTLPPEVGNLHNLQILLISNNRLSGEIPATLGDCLSLNLLNLSSNNFQGTIPLSLDKLKGLKNLDLSINNLSGQLPDFLAHLPNLKHLNLSFNDLDGELPTKGVFENASEFSVLGNNRLCGGIASLHLHPCPGQTPKRKKFSILKVIIPVLVLLFVFGLFATYYLLRNSRKHSSSAEFSEDEIWKVGYVELMKATDGFSSDNLIGVGGYGSVYRGIIGNDKTVVAIKVLNLEQRGALNTFMAECEALRNIRHRNLVKILTTCVSSDLRGNEFRALLFEFMPNWSLDLWIHPKENEKLQSKRLDLFERLNIAIDVASALDYLHNHLETPIVHCDLKPSNVLLDGDMIAHVGDFGLSKFLAQSSINDLSSSLAVRGSIGYIAPEYGIGGQVSPRADVYSYGIILLEMFTGIRPTDDMFKDGLTLQKLVAEGILRRTEAGNGIAVADPSLYTQRVRKMDECIESMMIIGLSCAKESPRERLSITEALSRMETIRSLIVA